MKTKTKTLSPDLLRKRDAYWRATNYLSVGQLYLYDNMPEKSWKFSLADVKERAYWDDYMNAFEDVFNHASTEHVPWYIIPADNKWFTRTVVADVIVEKLRSLKLSYPVVNEEHRQHLLEGKELLKNEPS